MREASFANSEKRRLGRWIGALLVFCSVQPFTSPAEPTIGEIVWKSPDSPRSPAIRIRSDGLFACLRPDSAAKAPPRFLRLEDRKLEVDEWVADPTTDLLVFKVSSDFSETEDEAESESPRIAPTPTRWPKPGSPAVCIGAEAGSRSNARIAGRDLIYQGKQTPVTLLRVHLDAETGVAGGRLLFDENHQRLLGFLIPVPLANPGEFHAVPAVFVSKLIRDFETGQAAAEARLGASFELGSTTPQIVTVRADSPADRAGLKKGDVILRLDAWRISRLSDVIEALKTVSPDIEIELEVLRGLEVKVVTITPEAVRAR